MKVDYAALGKRIRDERMRLHLSQNGVAELAGISTSFYGKIERGETKASLETFVAIVCVLNVSADALLVDALRHNPISDAERRRFISYVRTAHDVNEEMLQCFFRETAEHKEKTGTAVSEQAED